MGNSKFGLSLTQRLVFQGHHVLIALAESGDTLKSAFRLRQQSDHSNTLHGRFPQNTSDLPCGRDVGPRDDLWEASAARGDKSRGEKLTTAMWQALSFKNFHQTGPSLPEILDRAIRFLDTERHSSFVPFIRRALRRSQRKSFPHLAGTVGLGIR